MNFPERIGNEGNYYFKNSFGMLSQKFYYADNYIDGFALVKVNENSAWQFRDDNGNLSDEFYYANPYSCGFATVMKE